MRKVARLPVSHVLTESGTTWLRTRPRLVGGKGVTVPKA